ncbi:hypothetical protein KIN20_011494 [Parelaphostrongylus tenuis]|uniref:Uncharacterized protein n=1 Tax=Parelaphostrongylus tenuis TaxID=148309 RepID=A0AAD5QMI1_PARTN|nr:hypothetical protein KIN20_011494 [Parelaphostrongylus tenuis]
MKAISSTSDTYGQLPKLNNVKSTYPEAEVTKWIAFRIVQNALYQTYETEDSYYTRSYEALQPPSGNRLF